MTQVFTNDSGMPIDEKLRNEESLDGASRDETPVPHVRIAILGAGFAGLGMAIQLKRHGYDDFVVLERAADVGGTWRDNTYPGCACDIPSHLYSFSFAPDSRLPAQLCSALWHSPPHTLEQRTTGRFVERGRGALVHHDDAG